MRDFHPYILASGLFWTIPIPEGSYAFGTDGRSAHVDIRDVPVVDQTEFPNRAPTIPTTLLYMRVTWTATSQPAASEDASKHFAFDGWHAEAQTITSRYLGREALGDAFVHDLTTAVVTATEPAMSEMMAADAPVVLRVKADPVDSGWAASNRTDWREGAGDPQSSSVHGTVVRARHLKHGDRHGRECGACRQFARNGQHHVREA